MSRQKQKALVMRIAVWFSAAIAVLSLLFLVGYILIKGIPHLSAELFAWEYNSQNVSLMPALVNTVWMTVLTLLFAVPV